jgi:hypothetical protein
MVDSFGPAATFIFYAAIAMSGYVFCLFFVPETRGHTLEEIEKHWRGFG